jgi:hypothetical protein
MAQSRTLVAAAIRIYINGVSYNEAQSVSYTLDSGSQELYGVDSLYPQEIVPIKSTVNGTINGLKLKYSGGLQAKGARPLANDILKLPYVSIRIQDRQSGEDILLIPKAVIASETFTAGAKTSVKVNLTFRGIIPFQPLDRV